MTLTKEIKSETIEYGCVPCAFDLKGTVAVTLREFHGWFEIVIETPYSYTVFGDNGEYDREAAEAVYAQEIEDYKNHAKLYTSASF